MEHFRGNVLYTAIKQIDCVHPNQSTKIDYQKSANQSINQPTNQPTSQSVSQPVSQSVSQSVNQSTDDIDLLIEGPGGKRA